MLSVFSVEAIVGVTVGCFISNMLASAPMDMIVGTTATLVSALLTYYLRKIRHRKLALVPSIPPVLINAIAVGAELTLIYFPPSVGSSVWIMNIFSVFFGQLISCSVLGVILVYVIEQNPVLLKLMSE
jgi:uncharacterized membrane protein